MEELESFNFEHNLGFDIPEGLPHTVANFNCSNTDLCSLNGCPQIIKGRFDATNNHNLLTLEGGPQVVEGPCFLSNCDKLKSFEFAPPQKSQCSVYRPVLCKQLEGVGKHSS